jgi:hypothetical protein
VGVVEIVERDDLQGARGVTVECDAFRVGHCHPSVIDGFQINYAIAQGVLAHCRHGPPAGRLPSVGAHDDDRQLRHGIVRRAQGGLMPGRLYRGIRRSAAELLFDRRYGVRTSGKIDLSEVGLDHEDRVYYIASSWRTLRRTLQRFQIGPDDVFIDIGSGMGRMVLVASRFPFKRVIGVELVRELHGIAQENVQRTQRRLRCADVELVNSGILDYEIPDDVTFVYMFNPFRGQHLQRSNRQRDPLARPQPANAAPHLHESGGGVVRARHPTVQLDRAHDGVHVYRSTA